MNSLGVGYPLVKVLYHYEESITDYRIVVDFVFHPTSGAPYKINPTQQFEGWLCPKRGTNGEETKAKKLYGEP